MKKRKGNKPSKTGAFAHMRKRPKKFANTEE